MNAKSVGYWITTALSAFAFAAGGVTDLLRGKEMVEGMAHLGYPAYFMTILGTWKVAGAVAVLAPRFPRLKEWAYAGMFFDLTGAAASHAASGDPVARIATPLVLVGLVVASWWLRPESRVLRSAAPSSDPKSDRPREAVPAVA